MFKDMGSEQARQFFDRFLAESQPSLDLLESRMRAAGKPWSECRFDFSSDSLVPVWDYFLAHFTTQDRSEKELADVPDWVLPTVSRVGFSPATRRMIAWIGFYFAEVILRVVPQAKWGIAKSGAYKNQPILLGFKPEGLNSLHLVEVQAWKAVDGNSSPTALHDLLQVWLRYVI